MSSDVLPVTTLTQPEIPLVQATNRLRLWPAVGMVGLFWICSFVMGRLELPTFVRFLSTMLVSGLLTLSFSLWWLLNRRLCRKERLLAFTAALVGGIILSLLCHISLGVWMLVFMLPPYVATVWTLWLLLARRVSAPVRFGGLLLVVLLCESAFALIRFDGISGEQAVEFHWRWTPTAEELYQVELAQRSREKSNLPAGLSLGLLPGDWPGFRGPERDGVVRGTKIASDWAANPPKKLWRQRVGPGWSSMIIVDNRLFTQEQRGPLEAVVCLDAQSGAEIWTHTDEVRFWEGVAGAGPRATPQYADGCIYSLGATGILNCLDAATGERKWFHDIAADSGAKPPMWGFCSSPLVIRGVVGVFAGGENDKHLLAYHAQSGEPAWTAPVGQNSYSSPQRALLSGEEQILFWSDLGLNSLDPSSGKVLWQHNSYARGAPRSLQPHVVGDNQVLISSETDIGTACLDVKREKDAWTVSQRWSSRRMQPSFNDYVIDRESIYGFDGAIFCCIDLQTGERRWKDGRYGHGQVLLLADQSLLLVTAENGQVILLAANPEEPTELGRFQAINGKTWNHPAIAEGRLYVRNGEEIACYSLEEVKTP